MTIAIFVLIYLVSAWGTREHIKYMHNNHWTKANTNESDFFVTVLPVLNTIVATAALLFLIWRTVASKFNFSTNKFFGIEDRK